MTDHETTIDTHLAGYCEAVPAKRRELLDRVWTPGGQLIDPPMEATGPDGIFELVDALLQHYPQHRFLRTTAVDVHHGFGRYDWSLTGPDGTPAVTGTDIAQFDDNGNLVRIVGFFGDLEPIEA